MIGLLWVPECAPFSIALLLMLGIGALELLGLLLGTSSAALLDGDLTAELPELGAEPAGVLSATLSWLRVGELPLLLAVIGLAAFGLIGLAGQRLLQRLSGALAPAPLAAAATLAGALPCVRLLGGWLARLLPRDETSAVSSRSFIGALAHVVLGTARRGEPAPARLRDRHGRSHYVLVEPDLEGEEFATGAPVLLVSGAGAVFRCIRPASDALLDTAVR